MTFKLIGWVGSIMLAICGLPEAYLSIKRGYCKLSWSFLNLWLGGEILTLIPILFKIKESYLIFNYSANIMFILIMLYYKKYPRSKNE